MLLPASSSSSTLSLPSPIQMLPACWISLGRSEPFSRQHVLPGRLPRGPRQAARPGLAGGQPLPPDCCCCCLEWTGTRDGVAWMEAASIPSFLPRQRRNSRLWHCTGRGRHVFRAKPRFYTAQLARICVVRPSPLSSSLIC